MPIWVIYIVIAAVLAAPLAIACALRRRRPRTARSLAIGWLCMVAAAGYCLYRLSLIEDDVGGYIWALVYLPGGSLAALIGGFAVGYLSLCRKRA